jgi:hypothetical protein
VVVVVVVVVVAARQLPGSEGDDPRAKVMCTLRHSSMLDHVVYTTLSTGRPPMVIMHRARAYFFNFIYGSNRPFCARVHLAQS